MNKLKIPFIYGHLLGPFVAVYMVVMLTTLLIAQGIPGGPGVTGIGTLVTNDPISEYLSKGGPVAVIGFLLFFYRRDWNTALVASQSQSDRFMQIVEASTKAQTESAIALNSAISALAALTIATSGNTVAIQRFSDRLDKPKP